MDYRHRYLIKGLGCYLSDKINLLFLRLSYHIYDIVFMEYIDNIINGS